ncbi:MAG: ATP-binding protein [Deltaproteobacteria bacterium]
MNLFSLSGLSIAISCFVLAGISLYFGKTKLHRKLLLFNIVVIGWGIGLFLVGTANGEAEAKIAWIITNFDGYFVAPFFFHLTTAFCNVKRRKILYFVYGQAIFFAASLFFSNFIGNDFRYVFGLYYIRANFPYAVSLVFYIVVVILSYRELILFLRHSKGQKRTQALYNVFGFLIGFIGASTTFLPAFHIDIFYPAGNFGVTIYAFILTYAIFRHQLMGLTVIIKKTFVYSLILLMLIVPSFLVVILTEKYLPHNFYYPTLAYLFILVGFVFPRIKVQAERNLENILFKGTFDYRETLHHLSKKMTSLHKLEDLLAIATQTIGRAIDTKDFAVYLRERKGEFVLKAHYGRREWSPAIQNESLLIKSLQFFDEILLSNYEKTGEGRDRKRLGKELKAIGARLCIPIRFENELRGFMLAAEKESAGDYSKEEQNVLSTMARQLAVAIENSLKYDEINKLNTNLADRVKEIEELNVSLENKVRERTNELLQANEELKDSNISHELRTPLTNIILPIQNVLKNCGNRINPENRSEKEAILRNAHRLMKRINEILDLSRLEAGKMCIRAKESDLNSILDEIMAASRIGAEQMGLSLRFEPDPDLPNVWLDPEKIEKVFFNLVGNAMKFTPRGGEIMVTTMKGTLSNHGDPVPGVFCKVKDTGVGISAKDLQHIFERFRQADSSTSRKYEGTGLGLNLVKEFVSLHHGDIEVNSLPGEGSEFIVKLRLGRDHYTQEEIAGDQLCGEGSQQWDRRQADRRKSDRRSSLDRRSGFDRRSGYDRRSGHDRRQGSSEDRDTIDFTAVQLSDLDHSRKKPETTEEDPSKKNILVVEDNHDLAANIGRCLKTYYNVRISHNGKEAMEKLKEELPDLIVSDVMMPEMDGHELCQRVKEDPQTQHIPLVLLTARTKLEDRIDGYKHGADQYLSKPFNPQELQVVIESLLSQRELQAKLSSALKSLQEAQVQLVHSARLESVGLLAAGLAHEMKNKMYCLRAGLSGINKRLALLHEGKITLEDTYESLTKALTTNEKALEGSLYVVNALLDHSRKNKEGMSFADLNKGIEDTLTIAMPMVRDKISIEKNLQEIPKVECSLEEINQVLMNLIINAHQALTGPGKVRISTSLIDEQVVIVVSDNGPGIPPEHLDKIFTPFFSTKPEGKNTGLGLSICYNIIQGHHGAMSVKSDPGHGTEFTIILPVRQNRISPPVKTA